MKDYFSNQLCEWIFQQMLKRDLALNILKSSYFIVLAVFMLLFCLLLFCHFYALTFLENLH